jgi:RimJ/RimL family protein N-acetyltransferase
MRLHEVRMQILLARGSIRSWQPGDVGSLARHANDRDVWRNLRDRFPHPYTPSHARAWIREARKADPETYFAIAVGDEAVGGIGLELRTDVFRRTAEIGFWIGQAFWGRGLATEAVRAMTDFAFSRFELCRLSAGVFEGNGASMRVLEKAGFACEGRLRKSVTKDGRTLDLLLYGIVREKTPLP